MKKRKQNPNNLNLNDKAWFIEERKDKCIVSGCWEEKMCWMLKGMLGELKCDTYIRLARLNDDLGRPKGRCTMSQIGEWVFRHAVRRKRYRFILLVNGILGT